VFPDWDASGAMAAEHLLARGFRQFGYLGFERDIDSRRQLNGFRHVIRQAGFNCSTFRFSRTSMSGLAAGWEGFLAGMEKWIDTWKPPMGVVVC